MIIIDDKIIDPDILTEQFVCNLDACKGACCWEGDSGAPIEKEEIALLEEELENIKPFLTQKGIAVIEKHGVAEYVPQEKEFGTTLIDNAACAFLTFEENGMAKCGIEKAYEAGKTSFMKPISCHLYPIRVEHVPGNNFAMLDYDRWDICSAACTKGEALKVPVYKFLKSAIERKYGADFYEQLDDMAKYLKKKQQ